MDSLPKNILTSKSFERIGLYDHHGVNLPLFSLRSRQSHGVGEFHDLIPLIDWLSQVGFDTIQLLPLNDSGFESSPYNAFSSCALNPIFLSLGELPFLNLYPGLALELQSLKKYKHLQRLAYDAILNAKLSFLGHYFESAFKRVEEMPRYQQFIEMHHWLKPYALFKVLKEEQGHQPWRFWHHSIRNPNKETLKLLYQEKAHPLKFWMMIQYFCFDQLEHVKHYAASKNIFLMGDIPILISPESLDVWVYRKDFDLDYSAGSPPDVFAKEGQYWGFPLFRWDVIEQDGFSWWKERLRTASIFFDIYRIDHIIGFFRIWAIERGKKAIEGRYRPKDKWVALEQGKRILQSLIESSPMLPIGEDLGFDIQFVREAMADMGICGTKVIRWQKNYSTDKSFIPFDQYPRFSLTCVSTHDTDPLAQWWKNFPGEAETYARATGLNYSSTLTSSLRFELLKHSHHTNSLFHINLLNEYLALYPELVWPSSNDERINLPGTVHPRNWSYRNRPYIEDIISHAGLTEAMKSLLIAPQ